MSRTKMYRLLLAIAGAGLGSNERKRARVDWHAEENQRHRLDHDRPSRIVDSVFVSR